jgi:hypothetical protein
MTTLNLDSIVDVVVSVSPASAPRSTFNQLLIVGSTGISISNPITTSERVREYESVADMLTDGFKTTDAEYVAAAKYFAQSPAPQIVWIGVRDDLVSPPETILESLIACRAAEANWYQAYSTEAVSVDIPDIALWAEDAVPSTVYVYNTQDANVLISDPNPADIATALKELAYKRTMGQYSTTAHAIVGAMGVANGLNTGLANSDYTMFGKKIVSVNTENLSFSQKQIIEAKNCNVYLSYANYYTILEPGVMANGYFYDQVLSRDMLVNDIQLSCMDLLFQNPKIPQTETGMTMIHNALVQACQLSVTRGYLGAGTYTGIPFLNLYTGDAMPNGYVIQSLPLSQQSSADRALRKATPFYVTIKESGAVQSMTIAVYVNV